MAFALCCVVCVFLQPFLGAKNRIDFGESKAVLSGTVLVKHPGDFELVPTPGFVKCVFSTEKRNISKSCSDICCILIFAVVCFTIGSTDK